MLNERFWKRLSYAGYINRQFKFVFVETPKCACSTMKHIVYHIDNKKVKRVQVKNESSLDMSVHHRKINPHDGFFSMRGD